MSFACHSYAIRMYSYVIRMSLVCTLCHPYVTRMYSYIICVLLVSTHMSPYVTRMSSVCHSYVLVCHLYVLVCHSYVIRMYSYVIRISLVCTRISSVCHSSVPVCNSPVVLPWTRIWSVCCGFTMNHLWLFVITGNDFFSANDFFYGREVHSLLVVSFSKESTKVKKVSNFNLLDTYITLIHVSRNKKWIDIITHAHFSRNRKI